jgi:hypothetical protein
MHDLNNNDTLVQDDLFEDASSSPHVSYHPSPDWLLALSLWYYALAAVAQFFTFVVSWFGRTPSKRLTVKGKHFKRSCYLTVANRNNKGGSLKA